MMESTPTTGQWLVSLRSSGEILTASAREPGLELGLLGVPEGYTAVEIEGWLHDLIGVARETSKNDLARRSIPALLHHGLTGLLFSHEQLWTRPETLPPCSYAFVEADGWVGFGWVGEAEVKVAVDGVLVDPHAVTVRDDEGREARAMVVSAGHALDVELTWPENGNPARCARLEARWRATQGAQDPSLVIEKSAQADQPARAAAPPPVDPAHPRRPVEIQLPSERTGVPLPQPIDIVGSLDPLAQPLKRLDHVAPPGPPAHTETPEAGPSAHVSHAEHEGASLSAHAEAAPTPQAPAYADETRAESPAPAAFAGSQAAPAPPPVERGRVVVTSADAEQVPVQLEIEAAPEHAEHALHEAREDEALREEPDETPRRKSGVLRLFSRLAFWRKDDADDASLEEPMEEPIEAPLYPVEPLAHNVPGVPEQIPPTPEAGELTERAVQHYEPQPNLEADASLDPHALDLDGAGAPAPAAEMPGRVEARGADGPRGLDEADELAAPPRAVPHDQASPRVATMGPEHETVAPATDLVARPPAHAEGAPPEWTEVRRPLRPEWPSSSELTSPQPLWKKPWAWGVLVLALFAGGWLVGNLQTERPGTRDGMKNLLKGIGFGAAQFEVMVNSRPPGAWIAIDGVDIARRTPASIELSPGSHEVTLSFSELGGATYTVRGVEGDRVPLDAVLWGAIEVYPSDANVPVAVSIGGVPRGFAPLRADSLAPGAHEIRFSGPGLPSWGQTIQVHVNETAEIIARPMTSPATGLIDVQATIVTSDGERDVSGATVWVNGERRGQTPLVLELPRGPHSIRVAQGDESSPVQVIDLPGGNQRFARFRIGGQQNLPELRSVDPPSAVPLDHSTSMSMLLSGVQPTEVRDMWLHVETPDGPWRRLEMAMLKAPEGVMGVTIFPTTLFSGDGRVRYYGSAITRAGDEYFTEIQTVRSIQRPKSDR